MSARELRRRFYCFSPVKRQRLRRLTTARIVRRVHAQTACRQYLELVSHALWDRVRPLLHSLTGDANGVGDLLLRPEERDH